MKKAEELRLVVQDYHGRLQEAFANSPCNRHRVFDEQLIASMRSKVLKLYETEWLPGMEKAAADGNSSYPVSFGDDREPILAVAEPLEEDLFTRASIDLLREHGFSWKFGRMIAPLGASGALILHIIW